MLCRICGADAKIDLCSVCIQTSGYLDKYPALKLILSEESLDELKISSDSAQFLDVSVRCQKCDEIFRIGLVNLLKQLRRNMRCRSYFFYRCHRCSKVGKSGIGINTVRSVIDYNKTVEKFGGLPKNVKKGKVVAICEDCKQPFDIKLSSLLHQARRHKLNGRDCVYKCFSCGIKRKDAMEKSAAARYKQLTDGFVSGLELAAKNRLDFLDIKYVFQFKIDMYSWDFFLPDYNVLIDVNGEYWHSLPENVSRDKAKNTYTRRYYPQYDILYIEEKNFLNPLLVDKIILNKIGKQPKVIQFNFDFSDVKIKKIDAGKSSRAAYVNFLNSYHYSRCGRFGKPVYGAFLKDKLIAVCKFNSVTRKETASSMDLKCYQTLELNRFCIHPNHQKKNFASWFISRCIKAVFDSFPKVLGLVSFADETFGHTGAIYKASNWVLVGRTKASYHYMDQNGVPINKKRVYDIASKLRMKEREYAEKHGLEKFMEKPKTKFVFRRSANS